MTLGMSLFILFGAVAIAAACLAAVYLQRKQCNRKQEAAETGIYHVQKACETRGEALKNELRNEIRSAIESLGAGLQGPERALAEGRMSRTSRAEALRLLRSGIGPETAAATLGMPKHDLVLLAKVANVLTA